MGFNQFKKSIYTVLDVILGALAIIVVIYMFRHLIDLLNLIWLPINTDNFSHVMQEITSFFMLFEFVIMLVRYIQEGHHIPIRYLILISMTAILRQLLVLHDQGVETLLLAGAILLLAVVLLIFSLTSDSFKTHTKTKISLTKE